MGSEAAVIRRTSGGPVTCSRIRSDLAKLGVRPGDKLLVHAALSALGFVPGGSQAVIEALMSAVGPKGLLVMPTFTTALSDPAGWRDPPVPPDWIDAIRSEMPAYDPALSPTRKMGVISETFRSAPAAIRSSHPQLSFAAWGADAQRVVEPHPLEAWLGEGSPLARLYAADARVLLLGTGFATCTAFHLGEHRAGKVRTTRTGLPAVVDGARRWIVLDGPDYDDGDFEAIGEDFEGRSALVRTGRVGMAYCRLLPMREIVDFATEWLRARR